MRDDSIGGLGHFSFFEMKRKRQSQRGRAIHPSSLIPRPCYAFHAVWALGKTRSTKVGFWPGKEQRLTKEKLLTV